MKYGDLPERPAQGVALYCLCGSFSATRGDYFHSLDREIASCPECKQPLILAKKVCKLVRVTKTQIKDMK